MASLLFDVVDGVEVPRSRRIVRNWLNYDPFAVRNEVNRLPSLTQPDEAMSIREILVRHSQGLPLTGVKVPVYEEDNDLPEIKYLDLADRQSLIEEYKAELDSIKATRKERAAKLFEERVKAEADAREKAAKDLADKSDKSTNTP